jgi:translocation and assembly module TamA
MRDRSLAALLCLIAWQATVLALPAAAQNAADAPDYDPDQQTPYVLALRGLDDSPLKKRFLDLSLLQAEAPRGKGIARIEGRARLRSRLATDVETLESLLRSEGHYGAQIRQQIAPAPGPPGSVIVLLTVEPGPQFRFGSIDLGSSLTDQQRQLAAAKGLKEGEPARSAAILAASDVFGAALPTGGYPFFLLGKRDVVVDHAAQSVSVKWPVDPGPRARIGEVRYVGAQVAKPRHLAVLSTLKSGDIYDSRKLDDFRQALLSTGLYGSLNVYPQYASDSADGMAVADIIIDGQPTTLRSWSLIGGYSTREGPRGEVSWQHRNLFGSEEQLTVRTIIGTIEQSARVDLQKFNVGARDQTVLGKLGYIHEDSTVLETHSVALSGGIERQNLRFLQRKWTWSALGELGIENVKRGGTLGIFYTVGLPASLRYDGTDDLFDPTRGFRASATLIPEMAIRSGTSLYLLSDIQLSGYHTISSRWPLTLGARVRAGSIAGSALAGIPATRRFYAGGGGSIRGFDYREVSPLDGSGNPSGGRSIAEFSFEARLKITPSIGIVPFIDAGSVYTSTLPRFSDLRWGAGVGLRYFAGFAPLRVDVATPINRRPGDPNVAFYVSIGQSF